MRAVARHSGASDNPRAGAARRAKIGLDAREMFARRPRGIGRTLLDAYESLTAQRPNWDFILYHRESSPTGRPAALLDRPNVRGRRIELSGDRFDLWFHVRLPLAAWMDAIDLLHLPANAAPAWLPVRGVVTVHDLIPLEDEELPFAARAMFERGVQRGLRRTARVITPSAFTRDALIARFDVPSERLAVVPWAADRMISESLARRGTFDSRSVPDRGRYLLNFSGDTPRKNAERLIEAFARATSRHSDVRLVMLGISDDARRIRLEQLAERLGVAARVRMLPFVPHADLSEWLADAAALLMPSLSEGFGLPVLDAFAAGAPVLASNVTSLPEVAGDAAEYCDPRDVHDIAAGIERVLNSDTAARMRSAGLERLREFSWERTARELGEVFEQCLSGGTAVDVAAASAVAVEGGR